MGMGLFPGVGCQRLLPSQQRVMHQLYRAKHRFCLGEVVGQLGGVGPRSGPVKVFQRLGNAGVQPHLTVGRQLLG